MNYSRTYDASCELIDACICARNLRDIGHSGHWLVAELELIAAQESASAAKDAFSIWRDTGFSFPAIGVRRVRKVPVHKN